MQMLIKRHRKLLIIKKISRKISKYPTSALSSLELDADKRSAVVYLNVVVMKDT